MALPEEPVAPAPEAPKMIRVARFDAAGIFQGDELIEEAARTATHVEVAEGLKPYCYRLEGGELVPIEIDVLCVDGWGVFQGVETIKLADKRDQLEAPLNCPVPGNHRLVDGVLVPIQIGVARLDEQGVFRGVDVIEKAAKDAAHIEVPLDCDLTPGRYQLKDGAFVHIAPQRPATDTPPVVALDAIAETMLTLWDSKVIILPERVMKWLDFYAMSIDFAISATNQNLRIKYLLARGFTREQLDGRTQ